MINLKNRHPYNRGTHRVLVTGSRNWADSNVVLLALEAEKNLALSQAKRMVVVHGACRTGADLISDSWARDASVRAERHPARWQPNGIYNPQAGLLRNRLMVKRGADVCLAFIRDGSRGASHCARLAEEAGIPVNYYRA